MATYEYKCKKCNEKFEIQRSMFGGKSDVKCPKCGETDVERVYDTFGQGDSCNVGEQSNRSMFKRPT